MNKIPSGYELGKINQYTPQQSQLFKSLFSNVGPSSYLSRLAQGDEALFAESEAPAMRQFGELQGNIASRFSGMGRGARGSSGFKNSMNQASSNFAQDLQSQRQNLQRQALSDLMGMSNQLLGQRPNEQFLTKKQHRPSFLESLIQGISPVAGAALGTYFGGPEGGKLGMQAGQAFGQGFGNYGDY